MDYQEFLEYIQENIGKYVMKDELWNQEEATDSKATKKDWQEFEEYEVELHKIMKNNGIVFDGITIRKGDESVSPNIYLNSYFESYQMGKPLAVIMEEIVYRYQSMRDEYNIEVVDIRNFKNVKNDVVLRLVNYEHNHELLKTCPYKRFLDLAITFRFIASRNFLGVASSLITNEEFAIWNIDLEELYRIALSNTMQEFPWRVDSLSRIVTDCLRRQLPEGVSQELEEDFMLLEQEENSGNMFVLSNEAGLNGATCILYDSVLRNFARMQGCNIFILPSSIHEVMLVPEDAETEPEFLESLVIDANQSAVGLIDLLSSNVYYYDREKNQISIYGEKVTVQL